MKCKKCKKEIEDDSVYCRFCGRKQVKESTQRRPNNTGSVYKLPGHRENPWAVVMPKIGKKRQYGGYYATKTEATIAANKLTTGEISDRYNDTVETIYEAWKTVHFKELSGWGEQGYKTAWTYFSDIKSMKMRDIKTDILQTIVDRAVKDKKSRATCEKIRNLASQLCKYAMQQDLINKNYAQFLSLPKQEKKEKEIFTDKEIAILFEHKADNDVRIILVLIYTGFRIDELLSVETADVHIKDGYMIGGEKTEAGENRIVPINEKIMPFVRAWYETAIEKKYKYLIVNSQGNKMNPNNYRNRGFYRVLGDLKFQPKIDKDHPASKFARLTPHSTRHTFASLAVRADIKPEVLQKLIGHAHYETTADIYIHDNIQQLKDGIKKM